MRPQLLGRNVNVCIHVYMQLGSIAWLSLTVHNEQCHIDSNGQAIGKPNFRIPKCET